MRRVSACRGRRHVHMHSTAVPRLLTAPLVVSLYPSSSDIGIIATDIAVRSRDDKTDTISSRKSVIRHGVLPPLLLMPLTPADVASNAESSSCLRAPAAAPASPPATMAGATTTPQRQYTATGGCRHRRVVDATHAAHASTTVPHSLLSDGGSCAGWQPRGCTAKCSAVKCQFTCMRCMLRACSLWRCTREQ